MKENTFEIFVAFVFVQFSIIHLLSFLPFLLRKCRIIQQVEAIQTFFRDSCAQQLPSGVVGAKVQRILEQCMINAAPVNSKGAVNALLTGQMKQILENYILYRSKSRMEGMILEDMFVVLTMQGILPRPSVGVPTGSIVANFQTEFSRIFGGSDNTAVAANDVTNALKKMGFPDAQAQASSLSK
jgi:hypothetical protein